MKLISFAALLIIFSFSTAHAAKAPQKAVELEYEAASAPRKTTKTKKVKKKQTKQEAVQQMPAPTDNFACNVQVNDIVDARKNKVTLGTNGIEPLLPTGLDQWLLDIKKAELVEKTKNWTGARNVQVTPSLTKLYGYAENMNIHGVFSVTVDIAIDGKTTTKKYRGMVSKANMVNGYGEYATALNYAVHEVMPRLVEDLKAACK